MLLPPILDRELRLRAQLRKTTWIRMGVVAFALFGWLAPIMIGRAAVDSGRLSAFTLSFFPMLLSVFCGMATTADCISREKREGTLPLLLLTALTPRDILVQKMISTAAPFLSGLMAMLPLYALPVLLGGVTGSDVAALSLLSLSTATISLSIGILVSCFAWTSTSAVCGTFLVTLAFFGGSFALEGAGVRSGILLELAGWSSVEAYVRYLQNPTFTIGVRDAFWIFFRSLAISFVIVRCGALLLRSLYSSRVSVTALARVFSEARLLMLAPMLILGMVFMIQDDGVLLAMGLIAANLAKLTVLLAAVRILGNRPWVEAVLTTPLNPVAYILQEAKAIAPRVLPIVLLCLTIDSIVVWLLPAHLREVAFVLIIFVIGDSIALSLVGVWNGLKCRSASHAISLSISSVVLLPFVVALLSLSFGFKTETLAGALVLWTLLGLLVDSLAAANARWLLAHRLRLTASTAF